MQIISIPSQPRDRGDVSCLLQARQIKNVVNNVRDCFEKFDQQAGDLNGAKGEVLLDAQRVKNLQAQVMYADDHDAVQAVTGTFKDGELQAEITWSSHPKSPATVAFKEDSSSRTYQFEDFVVREDRRTGALTLQTEVYRADSIYWVAGPNANQTEINPTGPSNATELGAGKRGAALIKEMEQSMAAVRRQDQTAQDCDPRPGQIASDRAVMSLSPEGEVTSYQSFEVGGKGKDFSYSLDQSGGRSYVQHEKNYLEVLVAKDGSQTIKESEGIETYRHYDCPKLENEVSLSGELGDLASRIRRLESRVDTCNTLQSAAGMSQFALALGTLVGMIAGSPVASFVGVVASWACYTVGSVSEKLSLDNSRELAWLEIQRNKTLEKLPSNSSLRNKFAHH